MTALILCSLEIEYSKEKIVTVTVNTTGPRPPHHDVFPVEI